MDSPMSSTLLNGLNSTYRAPASSPGLAPDSGSGNGGLAPHSQSAEPLTGSVSAAFSSPLAIPDPQMTEKAKRRRFSKAYKLRIVDEADECTGRGELGALLRREGLYASTLANFRRQEAEGLLDPAVTRKPRASKDPELVASRAQRLELERDNRDLRRKLARAERIIAIQKKAAILLGETLQDMSLDEMD